MASATHFLRVPAPVSALCTWCGLQLAEVPADGFVTGVPDAVDCERCQRAMWATLEALRAAKDGAILFSFTDWRQLPSTTDAVQGGGWVWRGIVPWNKTEASRPQLGRPRAQCEYCVFATKGPHEAWHGAPAVEGFFTVPTPRERIHIAEKPLELMLALVSLVPPGGLVLDPFCGSGTTGVAAIRLGRRALLFEAVPGIARDARDRLAAEAAQSNLSALRAGQEVLPL